MDTLGTRKKCLLLEPASCKNDSLMQPLEVQGLDGCLQDLA